MMSAVGRVTLFVAIGFCLSSSLWTVHADETVTASETSGDQAHDHSGPEGDPSRSEAHGETGTHDDGHSDDAAAPPLLQFDFGSAICNLAIFLGVFAILAKFVWPVILDGLQARETKIHGDLQAAEQANAEAKNLLAEYQTKLDEAASQVQGILAQARTDAEASGQRIVEQARAEADRQRERAITDIETAKKVALSELAGQTSDMAINVAKQVVGRELKADDHADLIRQALDRVPSNS
jgi:F-type H+-transporting ATPase subunit b